MGQQRVIAPLAGIAVVACALLGQSVGLADGGVQVNGQGPVAGSRPGLPSPGQQLAAHPVELTDVAPPEAAAGRCPEPALAKAGGGWRLHRARPGCRPSPRCATHRRRQCSRPQPAQTPPASSSCRSCSPAPGHRPGRGRCRTSSGRPRCRARVAGRSSPALATRRAVVEGDLDPVGVVAWQHLLGAPFPGSAFCYKTIIPRSTGAPSCRFRTLTRRPPSVDSG